MSGRILAKLDTQLAHKRNLFQVVVDEELQAVAVLKYLTAKDLRNVYLTCTALYESCNSKQVYKALYETRFGRTGFGL